MSNMKYTIGEIEKKVLEKASTEATNLSYRLSEICRMLDNQEEEYEKAQAERDKMEEEYAEWKTTQAQGVDRKGDN